MTRSEDVAYAVSLGAAYVGVIFAGGPRARSPEAAASILSDVPKSTRKVGVFGDQPADEICAIARAASLDVVQLHGGTSGDLVQRIRACFRGEIWAVARLAVEAPSAEFSESFGIADGVLLDALVPGALGGNGRTLPWAGMAAVAQRARDMSGGRLVLAGGLRPENVATAIAALAPDVVDVSSGVESEVGVKNHERMRAFRDAVVAAEMRGREDPREPVRP